MSGEEEILGAPSPMPAELSDDGQMFAAEYKDGQLQIVEVSPYDKVSDSQSASDFPHGAILPDLSPGDEQTKYLQLQEYDGKGLMQLNLLNFALVKSEDGSSSYQLVSAGAGGEQAIACLLSDGDDEEPRESSSYVMLEAGEAAVDPRLYLQSNSSAHQSAPHQATHTQKAPPPPAQTQPAPVKRKLTPVEILEKAKAIQKIKGKCPPSLSRSRGRRRGALPPPLELLSAPGFKLYLYSCKLCSFKCNAVKEMSAHKKAEHSVTSLQCPKCPYRTTANSQLLKHTRDAHTHPEESTTFVMSNEEFQAMDLNSSVMSCDVLVCGACGFESGARAEFLAHIAQQHARAAL